MPAMRPFGLAFVFVLFALSLAQAEIVPGVSIKSLVDSSDLVIVGSIPRVQTIGGGTITFGDTVYERLDFRAEMEVDETLKGEPVPRHFVLDYSTPSTDQLGNVSNGGLRPNTYAIVFLKKTAQGYGLASPYTPFLAVTEKSCGANWPVHLADDPYAKTLERALSALCVPSSRDERKLALFHLSVQEDLSVLPFLKAALSLPQNSSDPQVRVTILAHLLAWKDLGMLPLAERDLFEPSAAIPGEMKWNLLLAISGLDPQTSLPLLARALKLPDSEARLAAARALEYTNSSKAVDVLLTGLEDPDRGALFAVMQSLGNLTKHYSWRPGTIDTDAHWNECLEHWREIAATRTSQLQRD
jgi:hypothetical protein